MPTSMPGRPWPAPHRFSRRFTAARRWASSRTTCCRSSARSCDTAAWRRSTTCWWCRRSSESRNPTRGCSRSPWRVSNACADETVMVGDSWAADVMGALAAGIRPIWFNRNATEAPAGAPPVPVIASFDDVDDVLRTIFEGECAPAAAGRDGLRERARELFGSDAEVRGVPHRPAVLQQDCLRRLMADAETRGELVGNSAVALDGDELVRRPSAASATCAWSSSRASQLMPQVRLCLNRRTGRSQDSVMASSRAAISSSGLSCFIDAVIVPRPQD